MSGSEIVQVQAHVEDVAAAFGASDPAEDVREFGIDLPDFVDLLI